MEHPPKVDAALMRLARHVTLPLEDAVSFRDVLDRKIDQDLKRSFSLAGWAARPAMALASVSKALELWGDQLLGLQQDEGQSEALALIRLMKTASSFLSEASIDIIRSLARLMLMSVTARRALWLRPWNADSSSKQAWCRIPFEGVSLFGDKLDSAISKATGGKSGFLPQDRRFVKSGRPQRRQSPQGRFRESRTYRPGREFRRAWRSPKRSFPKAAKNPTDQGRGGRKGF